MGIKAEKAVQNHKCWYPCSAAVLCAFAEDIQLTEEEARSRALPDAGGRAGKCGAVMAAEVGLKARYGDEAEARIRDFEQRFMDRNGSVQCRALRRNCRKCVTDAASIAEDML